MPMRPILFAAILVCLCGCAGTPTPDTGKRVQHWVEALRGPDARQRKEAAFKLGNLGRTDPDTIVPALIGALKDADAGVRCEAILALTKCGPAARDAGPTLAELRRRDPEARVRDYAAKAIVQLDSGAL
jgi:HEAT repeat protein